MTPATAVDLLERLTAALKKGQTITLSGEGVTGYSGEVRPIAAQVNGRTPHAGHTAAEVLGMVLGMSADEVRLK
jgi:hypothetical protein